MYLIIEKTLISEITHFFWMGDVARLYVEEKLEEGTINKHIVICICIHSEIRSEREIVGEKKTCML